MKRRIISIIMMLVMLFTMVPCVASATETTSSAETTNETETTSETETTPEETTPEDSETYMVSYSLDGGLTWEKDDHFLNAVSACYRAKEGVIKLKKDIILGPSFEPHVLCLTGNQLTIDGDGHTIFRGNYEKPFFFINDGYSSVTLKNITLDGGAVWDNASDVKNRTNKGKSVGGNAHLIGLGGYSTNSKGTYPNPGHDSLILEEDVVLQNNHFSNSGSNGAAIAMTNNSTVTMKAGAAIRNNTATNNSIGEGGGGAAVELAGGSVFNMEGGIIERNYASLGGGAAYVDGGSTFNMSGGKISGNVSGNNGGAVSITLSTFVMNSGNIENNNSYVGGAISMFSGTIDLKGGLISQNDITDAKLRGGGIAVLDGNLKVSGSPVVSGNTFNGTATNNIHLDAGKTIAVTGELTEEASLGINTATKPTQGAPVYITDSFNKDLYANNFVSDAEQYGVKYNDAEGKVQLLVKKPTNVSFDSNDGVGTMDPQTVYIGFPQALKKNTFTKEGYIFAGWNTQSDGKGTFYRDGAEITVPDDTGITLNAQWAKIAHTTNPEVNDLSGNITLSNEEVLDRVDLTDDEKSGASEINIYLTVEDNNSNVTEADKNAVKGAAAENDTIAAYLDVKLIKEIVPKAGETTSTEIGETKKPITVSLTLTEDYLNTDSSKIRTYYIIRVHDGKAEKLDTEFDPNTKILTFETDKFSTYAIAYSDAVNPNAPPKPSGSYPVIQKPIIETDGGADVKLDYLGTTGEITVKDGFEIEKITVNGVPVKVTDKLTGLKTGDKVVITTKKINEKPTPEERIAALKEFKLVARSKMSTLRGTKAVRVRWFDKNGADLKEFGFDGYEVWRSTKRYSGYGKKPFFTTTNEHYYNNLISKGTKYYYRVRGFIVIDDKKYYTDWSLKAWRTVK